MPTLRKKMYAAMGLNNLLNLPANRDGPSFAMRLGALLNVLISPPELASRSAGFTRTAKIAEENSISPLRAQRLSGEYKYWNVPS